MNKIDKLQILIKKNKSVFTVFVLLLECLRLQCFSPVILRSRNFCIMFSVFPVLILVTEHYCIIAFIPYPFFPQEARVVLLESIFPIALTINCHDEYFAHNYDLKCTQSRKCVYLYLMLHSLNS